MPVNLFYDGVGGGQAEPRTLTSRLRCEEWLKDARSDFGADADSGIADSEDHIRSGHNVEMIACIEGIDVNVGSLDRKGAAIGHGIPRVDNQVHDDLLDLAGVGKDIAEIGSEDRLQFDVFRKQASEHLIKVAQQLVKVEYLRLNLLFPAKCQELLGQCGSLFSCG